MATWKLSIEMDAHLFILLQFAFLGFCVYTTEGECTFYKKRFKEHQTIIQYHLKQNPGHCSGYVCKDSKIEYVESFQCKKMRKEEHNPFGCIIGTHYYRPQETIAVSYDKDGCELTQVCNEDGSTVTLIESRCSSANITKTTPPVKCFYNGQYYSPGMVVETGRSTTFCYTILCGWNGKVIHGDDFQCTTSNIMTTIMTTTTPPIHVHCYYKGRLYYPGTVIEEGQTGTWCYKTICSENGVLLAEDDFNCITSTTPSSTTEPTTATTNTA